MKITPKHAPKNVCRLPIPVGARVDIAQGDAIPLAEVLSYATRAGLSAKAQRVLEQLAAVVEAIDCDAVTYIDDTGPAYRKVRRAMDGTP